MLNSIIIFKEKGWEVPSNPNNDNKLKGPALPVEIHVFLNIQILY